MYCKHCGRQIADDSKFCEFCGQLVQKMYTEDTPGEPVEDIPAAIGEPIFKEVLPVEPADEPVIEPKEEPTRVMPVPPVPPVYEEEPIPEPVPPKKKLSKGALWGIIGGSAALVLTVVLILIFALRTPVVKVDVSQYVDFKVSGYDGYGIATCELDTDGLERAALGEYPSGSDSKSRQKQTEYKEKAAVLKSAVTLNFDRQENVAVGTELVATISVDRSVEEALGIEFSTNLKVTYTVTSKDLGGSIEIDVLGEFYDVEFTGFSGSATPAIITKERKEKYTFTTYDGTKYEIEPVVQAPLGDLQLKLHNQEDESTETVELEVSFSKTEGIANDEEIVLTLAEEAKQLLMEYGLSLTQNQLKVKAEMLDRLATDVADIDKTTLKKWIGEQGTKLEKYVLANWNDLIHGGNALATATYGFENLQCVGQVLAYDEAENKLFLMYSAQLSDEAILMDNYNMPRTYYFGVAIEKLIVNAEGNLLTDQLVFPTDDGKGYTEPYLEYADLYEDTAGLFENVSE